MLPVFVPKPMLDEIGEKIERRAEPLFQGKVFAESSPISESARVVPAVAGHGKRVVLASSGTRSEVEKYQQIARIEDLVESDTSSDDADRSKPHPDIFLAALKKLGNPDPPRT